MASVERIVDRMGPRTTKRKLGTTQKIQEIKDEEKGIDFFVDAPPDDENSGRSDADSTDTESSVYSDLEDESDDETEEEEEYTVEEKSDEEDSASNESDTKNEEAAVKIAPNATPRMKLKLKNASAKRTEPISTNDKKSVTEKVNLEEKLKTATINEYDYDSSDEEDLRNTIGNVPIEWYNDYPHIGYDLDGNKILKPATKDELDKFLSKMEDPDYSRTVHDKQTGKDMVLTDEDIDMIQKIQSGSYPSSSYDPYKPWVDIYSHEVEVHPLTNRPEHKRSFLPSKIEKQKVSKLVHAIKMGWIKPKKEKDESGKYYSLWDDNERGDTLRRIRYHIPAPKMKLPGHEESYNPPPEYLFTDEEKRAWLDKEPEDRKLEYLPQRYPNLRSVPAYKYFINERFERCLDLYLCARRRKMRMNVDPEDLIPKLPKPKDLQPFPTTLSLIYKGHTSLVRCITVEPAGQFLASGSDDKTIKIWEVITGRCWKTISVDGPVKSLAWCSNHSVCLLACAVNKNVLIINPRVGDKLIVSNTDTALSATVESERRGPSPIQWIMADEAQQNRDVRIIISHPKEVQQVTWHSRGDYFATVMANAGNQAVQVHQLTKRRSQQPFSKAKGIVQCVLFHPTKPYLFVATQRYVRIYNLMKQELAKKLMTNCKWLSSMAVHPRGDHVTIGSFDSRLSWFDLDYSTKPYQTLRHHKQAVRKVAFHRHYPLFASASDDCSIIVCHGEVYDDLMLNPLIVPVKVLRGHTKADDLGVLDCVFHPTQPWIFSSGADGTVRLYT